MAAGTEDDRGGADMGGDCGEAGLEEGDVSSFDDRRLSPPLEDEELGSLRCRIPSNMLRHILLGYFFKIKYILLTVLLIS